MDDPELLSPDVVFNMMISYRDVQVGHLDLHLTPHVISSRVNVNAEYRYARTPSYKIVFYLQDYDAMVSLVEDLEAVPNNKVSTTVHIQHLYAFALNRRNKEGDRDKALTVILKVRRCNSLIYCLLICWERHVHGYLLLLTLTFSGYRRV